MNEPVSRPHPAVITHVPGPNEGRHAKAPDTRDRGVEPTERAGAHSSQFGAYAAWTAGLLAALAVRPVPLQFDCTTRRE
jgi:hypothetical protein